MTKLISAIALGLLSITPAFAKDVTITLNDDEQKALMVVLDQAVRQGGLASVPQIWKFVQKLQSAVGAVPSTTSSPSSPSPSPSSPDDKK